MIRGEFSSEDGERRVLSDGGGELESARNAGASREPLSSPQWVSVSSCHGSCCQLGHVTSQPVTHHFDLRNGVSTNGSHSSA